jgi:hypothetical protein
LLSYVIQSYTEKAITMAYLGVSPVSSFHPAHTCQVWAGLGRLLETFETGLSLIGRVSNKLEGFVGAALQLFYQSLKGSTSKPSQ